MTSPQTPTATSRIRLLVVDDDKAITEIYKEVLEQHDFDVITAHSCADAMAKMDAVNGDAQVLVVDIGLPDGDGSDFVRDSLAKYGARPTMYVSGWTDDFWSFHDIPGQWLVLRKPVPIPRLLAGVRWLAYGGPKPAELDAPG